MISQSVYKGSRAGVVRAAGAAGGPGGVSPVAGGAGAAALGPGRLRGHGGRGAGRGPGPAHRGAVPARRRPGAGHARLQPGGGLLVGKGRLGLWSGKTATASGTCPGGRCRGWTPPYWGCGIEGGLRADGGTPVGGENVPVGRGT